MSTLIYEWYEDKNIITVTYYDRMEKNARNIILNTQKIVKSQTFSEFSVHKSWLERNIKFDVINTLTNYTISDWDKSINMHFEPSSNWKLRPYTRGDFNEENFNTLCRHILEIITIKYQKYDFIGFAQQQQNNNQQLICTCKSLMNGCKCEAGQASLLKEFPERAYRI